MSGDWTPLILTVAPNGASKTRADHPALPLTPAELARTAAECLAAGAAMIHLHVRDAGGRHTLDPERYRAAIEAIRGEVGEALVIQATSESAGVYEAAQQMAAMRELCPEAMSLAIREIVPDAAAEPAAQGFLAWAQAREILLQYILYSADDVRRYQDLRRRGVIPQERHLLLFVLGRYTAGQTSQPLDLLPFLASWEAAPPRACWAVCAFGAREHACGVAAAALGGHVRVGFENNLHLRDGRRAGGNAALVEQMRAAAGEALGRPLADAQALRAMLAA